jgi:RHS repeat-associated protein
MNSAHYYAWDRFSCVDGVVTQFNQNGETYDPLTPTQMETWLQGSFFRKVFRNAAGTHFIAIQHGYPGSIDGKNMSSYADGNVYTDVFNGIIETPTSLSLPCCLSTTTTTVSAAVKPSVGESVPVNTTLVSNYPISWQLNVNGTSSSGNTSNVTWSGKDANGFPLLPGVYSATLTVDSGGCSNTTSAFPVSVTEPPNNSVCFGCFGSDANLAGGGLTHSEVIIETSGGLLPLSLSLEYDSMDTNSSDLGPGWRHSMDITLTDAGSGSLLFREGGTKRLYTYSGGVFQSPAGDYGTLTTGAGGTHDLTYRNGLAYHFRADGKISTITDRYQNSLSFGYDGENGPLHTVTDTFNRTITFNHDPITHWLTSVSDPRDGIFTFASENGRLHTITDPQTDAGITPGQRTFAYDNLTGQLLSKLDQYNNLTQYTYDPGKRVKTSKDPEGVSNPLYHTRTITYPASYNETAMTATLTEKDGGEWKYEYNPQKGVITKVTAPAIAPDPARETDYSYAANGNLIAVTKPYNVNTRLTTFYSYDAYGNLLTETDPVDISSYAALSEIDLSTVTPSFLASLTPPINTAVSYAWDSTDRLTSMSNVRDTTPLTTTITYETEAVTGYELTTITDPELMITKIRRDPAINGQIVEIEDGNEQKTVFTYYPVSQDAKSGQLSIMTGPDNVKITISDYDRNGNPMGIQATDTDNNPIPVNTTLVYDTLNRLRSITQSLTTQGKTLVETYDYDQSGSLTFKDPEENANSTNGTRYYFNYNRKVKRMTDALSGVTELAYGGQDGGIDRLTKVEDPRQYARGASGKSTRFVYDKAQRLEREIDPSSRITRYTYYDNGLLKERYDGAPGNLLVSYTYNNRGQLLTRSRADGGYDQYTYKTNGFLDTAATYAMVNSVPTLVISYSLDWYKNGWLKSITDTVNNRTIVYDEYDGIGERKKVTFFSGTADQRVITYDYDKNRPWHITDDFGTAGNTTDDLTFTYGYDERGRRETLTWPGINPIVTTYGYDDLDQVTSLTHQITGGGNIVTFSYPLYDNAGNRKERSITADTTSTETYGYDLLYRIYQTVTQNGTEEFHYDPAANRTSGPAPMDTRYQADPDANMMMKGRIFDYTYDSRGNQRTRTLPVNGADKSWDQTWDGEDRLVKVEKTKGTEVRTVSFAYDPFGRRLGKTFTIKRGQTTLTSQNWQYVYDNEDIALEIFTPTSGPQEKTFFIHGPGIDEPLALVRNNQYYTYHADALGSIYAIADSAHNVIERYTYDTYGKPMPQNGFRNTFTFTAREWDKETGLYYYRERYKDLLDGSFISRDPLGFAAGDVNLWNYVSGNPINFNDPDGLLTNSQIINSWTAAGSLLGSTVGFLGGGGSGFLTGPAAVGAVPLGAVAGATAGGVAGGVLGNRLAKGILNMVGSDETTGTSSSYDKYGGYKKGKPCPPKGYKPSPKSPVSESVKSQDFKDYIRLKYGKYKDNEWVYVMQKYVNPRTGGEFKYHYWKHKSGLTYYHLR